MLIMLERISDIGDRKFEFLYVVLEKISHRNNNF